MKLTKLLPVGQRAGGVLRAAGSLVAIHHEAMPMPWQTTDTQRERERERHRSVCKSESVKQKATFTLHGSSDRFRPSMWHRSDMTQTQVGRKKGMDSNILRSVSGLIHLFPYLDMNQISCRNGYFLSCVLCKIFTFPYSSFTCKETLH